MGKFICFIGLACIFVLLAAALASSKTSNSVVSEEFEIIFQRPEFSQIGGYDFITIPETDSSARPGEPMLPRKNLFVFIPEDAVFVNVKIISSEKEAIKGRYSIPLAQPPVPISKKAEKFARPEQAVCSSGNFQKKLIEKGKIVKIKNNSLLSVTLFPIRYNSGKGQITFYKKIRFRVSYSLSAIGHENSPTKEKTANFQSGNINSQIKTLVVNPQQFEEQLSVPDSAKGCLPTAGIPSGTDIRYVIITNETFRNEFQKLADWKTKKGTPAEIYNLSWIYANYKKENNNSVFYSGNSNSLNNNLHFAVDLSGSASANLSFFTKYSIEHGWDFGYVEASADNIIWEQLNGANMTVFRNESAYVGINGAMAYTGHNNKWTLDSVNLSLYAGNLTYIRFRYKTDNVLVKGGWFIDNITVNADMGVVFSNNGSNENVNLAGFTVIKDDDPNPEAEALRDFITDMSSDYGIEWVLLGGDSGIVPYRKTYGYVDGIAAYGQYEDTAIPADIYYSDLDGDWNNDNDLVYGEVEDDIDLIPDVYVGRAPVKSITEVQTFVNKILAYEKNPPVEDYFTNALFLAEKLDDLTSGGDCKEEVDGYFPSYFNITKKYEKDGNINVAIAINEMNAGPHIVNHVGHGNTNVFSVNGIFRNNDADSLTNNPKNFILYTVSCNSNAFDSDSLSEHFMNNPNGGTVAYMGNSRYGWYNPGNPGGGPSDLYDQQFFNSLFNKSLYHLGQVFADSKIAYIADSQEDGNAMRWIQYSLNLLGDPELPVWTSNPQTFSVVKPSIVSLEQGSITLHVGNNSNSIADAVVCLWKGEEIYTYGLTDAYGNITLAINPLTEGNMSMTITAHNFLPSEGNISVIDGSAPHIHLISPSDAVDATNNITFIYNITDASGVGNRTLWGNFSGNWQENETNSGIINNTENNFTLYNLSDGYYAWDIYCIDNSGRQNAGFSANGNFTFSVNYAARVENIPPDITVVGISPSLPFISDNLICSATAEDSEQANLTVYWAWHKNGLLNISGSANISSGTNSAVAVLLSGNTTKNQNWTCSLIPYDGFVNGSPANSSVLVRNSAPSFTNLENKRVTKGFAFSYDIDAFDQNEDTWGFSIAGITNLTGRFINFTINGATGLLVNSTPVQETGRHNIEVEVSDGIDATTGNFSLTIDLLPYSASFSDELTTNFSAFDDSEIQNITAFTLGIFNKGIINFAGHVINLSCADLDSYVNISRNFIAVNSFVLGELNRSAVLTLYNLSFNNPRILRDGAPCPLEICALPDYFAGELTFNVTGFSAYSAEDYCGNGFIEIESGEECDLDNLSGQSCASRGYVGGTLACTGSCAFDTSGCSSGGGGGGGGGSSGIFHSGVYNIGHLKKEGITKEVKKGGKIKFTTKGIEYIATLVNITPFGIELNIGHGLLSLKTGEIKKFDLDNDNNYELSVALEKIRGDKASLNFKSVSEAVKEKRTSMENITEKIKNMEGKYGKLEACPSGITGAVTGLLEKTRILLPLMAIAGILVSFFIVRNKNYKKIIGKIRKTVKNNILFKGLR